MVQLALALESLGKSTKALAILQNRSNAGETSAQLDAMGVLAGRLKRRWLAERKKDDAERASELYGKGFALAEKNTNHDMAYYLGINLAFMKLAYHEDRTAAKALAEKVLEHCRLAEMSMWCWATQGEANLILGNTALALQGYAEAVASDPTPRQMESMFNQAMKIADLVNDFEGQVRAGGNFQTGRSQSAAANLSLKPKFSNRLQLNTHCASPFAVRKL